MKNRGITLIALIVTIILLLILSGVVINLALGEHGIIGMAKKAGEEYKIASIKERVEQEILALDADKTTKGETLTVKQALVELEENETFSEIDLAEETGICEGYLIKLGYDEFGNVVIEGINKDMGTRLVTEVTPKGYTKKDVTVTISIKPDTVKISNIEVPDGMIKQEDGTYKIAKNGTYHVKAILEEGEPIEKDIKIDTIDKLPPKDFSITAEGTTKKLSINASTIDMESTEDTICSGIDRYEYYLKKEGESKYQQYTSNTITGLSSGKYKMYVVAYDKAGNLKTSSNTLEINVIEQPASDYGQGEKVNYTANGISDWKIFYKNKETNEIFIIASDYLTNEKIPSEARMTNEGTFNSYWKNEPNYIEITSTVRNKYMMSWNKSITNSNIKCVSRLLDITIWNSFVRDDLKAKGVTAIGSPTLEMWIASWNDWYPNDALACNLGSDYGYYLTEKGGRRVLPE